MKTFAQFIAENYTHENDFRKGWMSPTGKAHLFKGEHGFNVHPEIKDKIKLSRGGWEGNINKAVRHGHTRFGSWGTGTSKSHYIHYDPKTGKDAALHALRHLQVQPGESVLIQQGKFTGGVNHVVKGHGQAIRVINEDSFPNQGLWSGVRDSNPPL